LIFFLTNRVELSAIIKKEKIFFLEINSGMTDIQEFEGLIKKDLDVLEKDIRVFSTKEHKENALKQCLFKLKRI
jgi:hypothetical protein